MTSSTPTLSTRLAPLLVAIGLVCGAASHAEAQEWVGTEVSAAVPSVVLGSSWASSTRPELATEETFVRGARFALCDPATEAQCRSVRPTGVEMNTYPRVKLQLDLPANLSIQAHAWSTLHEEVDSTIRQGIFGSTVRHYLGKRPWVEIGAGVATHAEARSEGFGDEGPQMYGPGTLEPAVLAGLGTWFRVGDELRLDVRLRAGIDAGDDDIDVYHANLVFSLLWQ